MVAGYCKLCREEEIKRHGKLVSGSWHKAACRRAGCKHPPEYNLTEFAKIKQELRIQAEKFRKFRENVNFSLEKSF